MGESAGTHGRRSATGDRIAGEILAYLAHGPASRSMIVRDVKGSNESVHGTIGELLALGVLEQVEHRLLVLAADGAAAPAGPGWRA